MDLSLRSPARLLAPAGPTLREGEALRHIARRAQAGIELVRLLDPIDIEKSRAVKDDTVPNYVRWLGKLAGASDVRFEAPRSYAGAPCCPAGRG